jgi:hypothetical protein
MSCGRPESKSRQLERLYLQVNVRPTLNPIDFITQKLQTIIENIEQLKSACEETAVSDSKPVEEIMQAAINALANAEKIPQRIQNENPKLCELMARLNYHIPTAKVLLFARQALPSNYAFDFINENLGLWRYELGHFYEQLNDASFDKSQVYKRLSAFLANLEFLRNTCLSAMSKASRDVVTDHMTKLATTIESVKLCILNNGKGVLVVANTILNVRAMMVSMGLVESRYPTFGFQAPLLSVTRYDSAKDPAFNQKIKNMFDALVKISQQKGLMAPLPDELVVINDLLKILQQGKWSQPAPSPTRAIRR